MEDYIEEKITKLNQELSSTQTELKKTLKKLAIIEHKYEKSIAYNEDLCKEIDKLNRDLHSLRKSRNKSKSVGTQVEGSKLHQICSEDHTASIMSPTVIPDKDIDINNDTESPITECLKDVAESAMNQSGFVYDEHYGLYYDYNTGYYYDSKQSLYYDPNTGVYYYYDQNSGKYVFHSQIDISQYRCQGSESQQCNQIVKSDDKGKIKDKSERKKKKKQANEFKEKHKNNKITHHFKKKHQEKDNFVEEFDSEDEDHNMVVAEGNVDIQHEVKVVNHDSDVEMTEACHYDDAKTCDGDEDSWNSSSSDDSSDIEEGEITKSSSSSEDNSRESSPFHWPPCIRVIVQESDCLDEGSLFILTCTGATIGREKDLGHAIRIPDLNVSKMHCEVTYDEISRKYFVKDHASQNGTYVNLVRISEPKIMGSSHPLNHGDLVGIGGTKFLFHIHPGTETCDQCEPGLVQAEIAAKQQENKEVVQILSKEEKEIQRKRELKKIRKKYGLERAPYVNSQQAINNPAYQDKAAERRKTKGSDNPYQKDDEPASVNKAICSSNVGHKLMEKMGWKSGESLGKSQAGIKEPINVTIRSNQTAGFGSTSSFEHSIDNPGIARKMQNLSKTQIRFQQLNTEGQTQQMLKTKVPSHNTPRNKSGIDKIFEDTQ